MLQAWRNEKKKNKAVATVLGDEVRCNLIGLCAPGNIYEPGRPTCEQRGEMI